MSSACSRATALSLPSGCTGSLLTCAREQERVGFDRCPRSQQAVGLLRLSFRFCCRWPFCQEREREPFEMQSCVCLVSLIPEAGSNDRRHLDRHLGPARRNVDLPRVAPRRFFDSLPQRSSHHREHTQRCSWKLVLRCTSCITAQVVIGGEPKRTAFSETSETCVHGAGRWCMTRVDCDDLPNSNVQSNNQSSLLAHRERRALTVPDFRSRASSHVEQIAVSPSINFRKSHTAFLLSVARWHPRM